MKILIYILTIALISFSCENETIISPEGEITSEYRVISDFEKLEVNSGIEVIVSQSDKNLLLIESNTNVLPYIETTIKNNTLIIQRKSGVSFSTIPKITAYLSCKKLNDITAIGASNVNFLTTLKAENLNITVSNESLVKGEIQCDALAAVLSFKSQLHISGNCEQFTLYSATLSKAFDYGFTCDDFVCDMRDGCTAQFTINKEITATLNKSSILYYAGNPKIVLQNVNDGSLIIKTK